MLGFAIKEGFDRNLKADHPRLVFLLGVVGFVVVFHAILIVLDHGWHINRTIARANKARDGESAPRKIWDAGNIAGRKWSLPPICNQLLVVVGLFAAGFAALILVAWMEHAQAKPPAYLISDITVNNETLFKEWADKINPTFAQFGAKYLVRGGQTIAIPGSGEPPKRTTLIVFESLDKAKAWNESDAVKQARSMPDRGAKFHSWLVEGAQ